MMPHFKWVKKSSYSIFLVILASCGADGQMWKGLLEVPLGKTYLVRNNGRPFWWTREFLDEMWSCLSGAVRKRRLGVPEADSAFNDTISNSSRVQGEMRFCG